MKIQHSRVEKDFNEIINETPIFFQRKYEINFYNVTLDTINGSLGKKISKLKEMYVDL